MVKKSANKNPVVAAPPPKDVVFPEISLKADLQCRVVLEDQILVIDVRIAPTPEAALTICSGLFLAVGMQNIYQVY